MKQPKLRFNADDGNQYPEWEEKRLEEVAVRITRKNKDNCTDIPLTISSVDGLIDQRDFFNKIVASKDMSGYYLLKRGEFAYNKSYSKGFDFGSIKRLNLYDEGALSTLYICFALNDNEDSDFYQKYFDSLSWYPELQKICAEGARNHGLLNVSANDFFQLKLHVPKSKEEQQKIASLFTELDNLIQSAEKELEGYRELKQGMLQKMFPKKGEKVPEIRFPEFTGDWEQRKLGELCDITTGKLDANAMNPDGEYDFYTSGIDVYKIDKAAFSGPAITIAGNGANVGYLHLADGYFNAYQRTYILTNFLANRQFLYSSIGVTLPCKIYEEVRGSGVPYIVLNMLTDLVIQLPSQEEQFKIAEHFSNLDNLITIQQKELDGYKELKKGLLQQMFC
ncbi:restriction endonuclease subunit S [Faecalicoccus pleomorphus]|uniref:restriction endonuclease subunit S n=1 Tax=Faecalicoccus pleomorphus TaxID=1323 RepID=UPI00232D0826|nr:restriction endonuclease subunit S [Faecalicoccus pleomorphus]MDB7989873.1 restriction endonuclease subunit S [Faecalicoccus pleomorphus]MDB7994361.1 restriction endonuclease subunit S [Faecalicoccus pleomorphus]